MAVAVGVRADSCTRSVPSLMRVVCDPHQARGVKASDPHDSAVQTESKPRASASATISAARGGGAAPQ